MDDTEDGRVLNKRKDHMMIFEAIETLALPLICTYLDADSISNCLLVDRWRNSIESHKHIIPRSRETQEVHFQSEGRGDIGDLDRLSSSASLLDIICLVDHSDLLSCQLVNRHLNQLIRRNRNRMRKVGVSQLTIEADFTNIETRVLDHLNVMVRTENCLGRSSFLITPHRLRILRCYSRQVAESIKSSGVQIGCLSSCPDSHVSMNRNNSAVFSDTQLDIRVDGMADGLSRLLSSLLDQYTLRVVRLDERDDVVIPQECLSMMTELFRERSARCDTLYVERVWPQISSLYMAMGCREVGICSSQPIDVCFPLLNCSISIWLSLRCFFDSMQPLIALIKQWSTGMIRIKDLRVAATESPWSRKEVVNTLSSSFQCFSVKYNGKKDVTIAARRSLDNVVLTLRYSRSSCSFFMKDTVIYDEK